MRILFKVRLKLLGVFLLLISSSLLLFTFTDIKNYAYSEQLQIVPGKGRRVASINAEDWDSVWQLKHPTTLFVSSPLPDRTLANATGKSSMSCIGSTCGDISTKLLLQNSTTDINNRNRHDKRSYDDTPTTSSRPIIIQPTSLENTNDNILYLDDIVRMSQNHQRLALKGVNLEALNQRINKMIRKQHLQKSYTNSNLVNNHLAINFQDLTRKDVSLPCDPATEICKEKKKKLFDLKSNKRGGYASRVKVEPITLPSEWSASPDLSRKLQERKERVQQVCQKYGLDQRTSSYQPNAWEFLIDEGNNLVWCSIFKAASSTWFYNFNILAGYSDSYLLSAKETPITLARKKYPRPSVEELDAAINSNSHPLTFMIARNPLERLVSAYRDKLQSGTRFYRNLARRIMTAYPDLGPKKQMEYVTIKPQDKGLLPNNKKRKLSLKYVGPSFSQFVQFIVDNAEDGNQLDEHWAPMSKFCTPCLVDFDVYAKVESLAEDGNYIIFNSGIENIIKPKRINRSKNEPTITVAKSLLCQLNADQKDRLINLYSLDMELFDYKYDHLLNCFNETSSDQL